jgi:hypothetical protein
MHALDEIKHCVIMLQGEEAFGERISKRARNTEKPFVAF